MICISSIRFLCVFAAVVIAACYGGADTITGSDFEVTVYSSGTDNQDSATTEPNHEVEETTDVDLGALLDAGDGAVVTLVAGETRLAAHRAVLAARSPVFAATFERVALEANNGHIAVTDVEGPVLRQLLAYMYTLQAPQLPSMASQLLAAADRYGLAALKAVCEQQVAAQLSVETAAAAAVLSVRHSSAGLRQAVVTFIRAHFLPVMATEGWADAMRSHPEDLIQVINQLSQAPAETSAPPAADIRTTPTVQPHSNHSDHGQDSDSGAPPTAAETTPEPDGAVSLQRASDSATTAATHSDGDEGQFAASAATPTAVCPVPPPDDAAVSRLRSLSAEEKDSILIEAVKEGAVEDVTTLLAAGTNVEARDEHGQTALAWAAFRGQVEAAGCLIARGAEVDGRTSMQYTPLLVAAHNGHTAVVRLLLAASANPNVKSTDGRSPLLQAAYGGHADVVRMLLASSADPDIRDNDGRTPLHVAAYSGHAGVVQLLVASSAIPDASDKDGRTPLLLAAYNGHVDVVRMLMASSADPKIRDNDGMTPLHFASNNGHAAVVQLLLASSVNPNTSNSDGRTPLHLAANNGHTAVVLSLLSSSADPNARDKYGRTPLHWAAYGGHAEVATALLEAGADKDAKDNWGDTPLDDARQRNYQQIIDILTH